MTPPDEADVRAGAAQYSTAMLRWYDLAVLEVNCRLLWRCPPRTMLELYQRNIGARHLDLGPGTGYFLDRCTFGVRRPQLTLLDLNPDVLTTAAHRLRRYNPTTHLRNVLEPLALGDNRFDSAGLNMVLHCIPGPISAKAGVFDRIIPYLEPGARIFGSTILDVGVPHSPAARVALHLLNRQGVFHNTSDTLSDLDQALAQRFATYRIELHGAMALFQALAPGDRVPSP
ncbi:Methyltransferase type 12 [Kribbella flavida DSM 17836]|uniref:Methyltransferase type 12 n=1 Tax=Kribbella flavida (strain DSM 17836 / JCM 10339 / NBRC 14399) TaxID=479435 RepID=D2PQE0_KRIFD|nr:class I SAM-dependent methyltransferase [Kribbella flavida]ADB34842.1 Methyltransferase type 12 [Kribbella flavida DSM 17836]